ncbi:MAG: S8 family serine peptidase [Candidatus Aminicenantes bacterium]|nr:S8 family serine peptidase [Candidatus Aminicenantes bacterium]
MNKNKMFGIFSLIVLFILSFTNLSIAQDMPKKPAIQSQNNLRLSQTIGQKPFASVNEISYSDEHILVKFRPTIPDEYVKATIHSFQISEYKVLPRIKVFKLKVPETSNVEDMLYVMKQHQYVEYAEPDYKAYKAVTPNDNFFNYQYALYNSGQYIGPPGSPQGQTSADIKATTAWEQTKGTEDVIIAIVDTGIDLYHPDLANKIESSGRDFVNSDFEALDDDIYGHGTFVAGIAAAETDNNEGIAGVAWNCQLLPVKVLDDTGVGYYSWIIEGIIWAVDNDAAVVNLSLGGPVEAISLQNALQYAHQNDVVVVAAAGNEGGAVSYPAAYDDFCLAVAATDYNDQRLSWSNYGPEIDVAAPGKRIISTVPTWLPPPGYLPYGFGEGTSLSTPYVAGLAALIKSLKPWISADEAMYVIKYSADDVNESSNPGKDVFIGYGRINMETALTPIILGQQEMNDASE